MVCLIRPLNESGKNKYSLRVLCVLKRPTGAGERINQPAFLHSIAEGLWN